MTVFIIKIDYKKVNIYNYISLLIIIEIDLI